MAGHRHVQSQSRVVRRAAKQAQARRASSFCCMHGDAWRKQLEDGRRAAKTPPTVGHKDAENDGAGKDPGEIPAKHKLGPGGGGEGDECANCVGGGQACVSAQTPRQASSWMGAVLRPLATSAWRCIALKYAGTHVKTSPVAILAVYHQVQGLCSGGSLGRMCGNGGKISRPANMAARHRNLIGEMPLEIRRWKVLENSGAARAGLSETPT